MGSVRADREKRAKEAEESRETSWKRIYAVVRRIPRGRVATYGQVAVLAGLPSHARLVGYALHGAASDGPLPWHRVINAQGRVSPRRNEPAGSLLQRMRLEEEGVRFDARGRVSLQEFGWEPRSPRRRGTGEEDRADSAGRGRGR